MMNADGSCVSAAAISWRSDRPRLRDHRAFMSPNWNSSFNAIDPSRSARRISIRTRRNSSSSGRGMPRANASLALLVSSGPSRRPAPKRRRFWRDAIRQFFRVRASDVEAAPSSTLACRAHQPVHRPRVSLDPAARWRLPRQDGGRWDRRTPARACSLAVGWRCGVRWRSSL